MRMSLVTEVAPPHTLPPGTIANSAPCTHLTLGYSPKLVELDFSDLGAKGVGYARHQSRLKEVIECVPYLPR
jgi:hypothetical protein